MSTDEKTTDETITDETTTGIGDADASPEVAESEDTTAADPAEPAKPSAVRQVAAGARRHVAAILVAVALVASAGAAAGVYFLQYRPDRQTDAASTEVALDAAKTGTVALLSYSPETLDDDFSTAKSHLTGEFLDYYTDFTAKVVAPAAKEKSVETVANVMQAAVSRMETDSAEVLLFINQTTTSQENPDGAFAASSVKVGLKKVDGNWLIESFDPV
ncbi:hypothetical protein C6A87_018910 [Mycobacterium sp. ITM-2016-00317]|uniref:hypothetical protein n=1 Tax=Mycobacterium sp. ITM-2016-00317 TaxID=2099694 RepID=UPI00287F5C2E|nr:hypothetical protein [Mycobacterium sp. ITM-2016-00317]WNG85971.1 hypothetical protein C6A87_018910 [Mycobacterium sp. ITM-2016-00317]